MADEVLFRPAPPLLAQLAHPQAGARAFRKHFRPGGIARDISGRNGRLVRFGARNEGVYSQFFKPMRPDPVRGSAVQRWSWVEDTVSKPDEIRRRAGNTRDTEFCLSRYELSDGTRVHYFVSCYVNNQTTPPTLEPHAETLDISGAAWLRVTADTRRVWPEIQEDEQLTIDSVESLAEFLGQNDQVLIVGPMRDQLPSWISENQKVIIWPSTELKGSCPSVPTRVRLILLTRFVDHGRHGKELSRVAHNGSFPIRMVTNAQIRGHFRCWAPEDDEEVQGLNSARDPHDD